MSNTIYSFYKLIKEYQIEVPVIQRDYAQGRTNAKAEDIRKTMVSSMLKAVTGREAMFLDFVYGRIEKRKINDNEKALFIPFDGQQRLTTLFLFHKYISDHNANSILTENLSNFSYATRQSSREFCSKFIRENCTNVEKKIISEHIKNQPWFYADWQKDPTIDGMLRMLDEIQLQIGTEKYDFSEIEERLTAENAPINFHFMNMGKGEYDLPDSTYIKMNARGKGLTIFENFKASLEEYLDKNNSTLLTRLTGENEDPSKAIQHGMDGVWLDLFWNVKNLNKQNPDKDIPDDLIMSFINRYLMNIWRYHYAKFLEEIREKAEEIEDKKKQKEKYEKINERIINQLLFYPKSDDFISFNDIYEQILDFCGADICLNPLFNLWDELSLNRHDEIINNCKATWEREKEDGWDLFKGNEYQNRETYLSRIAFYAVVLYFDYKNGEKYNETSFKQWMRIVWNIVENQSIDNPETYHSALQLIKELSVHSHCIYEWLANLNNKIISGHAAEQVQEEREKVCQIEDKIIVNKKEKVIGEKEIIEAEKKPFFKGKIGYLLKACENNVEKFKQILKLCQTKITKDNESVLKDYLTYIDRQTLPLYCNIHNYNNWKEILTSKRSEKTTIEFFKNNLEPQVSNDNWPDWKTTLINDFDEIKPLNCTIRNYYTNGWWGYDEEDVFAYVNANISAAKLLSSKRKASLRQLIENNVVQNHYPLYPHTNDHGQLWINHDSFTEDFKAELENPDQIQLFLGKNIFELKYWNNSQWEGKSIDWEHTDNIFSSIIRSAENLHLLKIREPNN